MDAGGTSIKAAAVNPENLEMSEPVAVPSGAMGGSNDYLNAVARTVRGLSGGRPESVQAVGLSLPGFMDRSEGNWCGMPNVPGWPASGLPLDACSATP